MENGSSCEFLQYYLQAMMQVYGIFRNQGL
jgi:hypothetical protein